MPPRYLAPGLSDFGLTAPSTSSNVGKQTTPDVLSELLGSSPNEVFDAQSKANMLDQYLQDLGQTKTPSTLDKLKSPQGILGALITALAAKEGGVAGGVGAGLGVLQGAQGAAEADATAKRNAQIEAQKQRDEALKRVDTAHQRFTSLLQSQPELFIDPETGKQTVPPDVLGFYATGTPSKLFATSKRALESRDKSWAAINGMLSDNLAKAQSVDDARKITDAWFTNMGYNAPPEVSEAIARSAGTPQFTPELMNTFFRYAGETALNATIQAKENGWGPTDPQFLSLLQFRDPDNGGGKITPADRALELSTEINDWQADPANLTKLREITTQSKNAEEKSMKIAQAVLGGREGDLRTYLHEMNLHDPNEWKMLQTNFAAMQQQFKLGTGLTGIDQLPMFKAMTPEQQTQWMWDQAQHATTAQMQQKTDDQAKVYTSAANDVAIRLGKELHVLPDIAGSTSASIAKMAADRATLPDGTVDQVRFQQELKKITDEVIAKAGKQ